MELYRIENGSNKIFVIAENPANALALIPDEHRFWFDYDRDITTESGLAESGTTVQIVDLTKSGVVDIHIGKKGFGDWLAYSMRLSTSSADAESEDA